MKYFVYLTLFILAVSGCKSSTSDRQPLLPTITGNPGDITVVIGDGLWEGEFGDSVKSVFYEEIYGLPDIEPKYDLMQIRPDAFGNMFKSTRNILIFDISRDYDSARVIAQRDVWAKPQMLIKVVAPDTESALKAILLQGDKVVSIFDDIERKRFTDVFTKSQNNGLRIQLERKHNVTFTVPNGYKLGMDSTDFSWIDTEYQVGKSMVQQGFFIYDYPYTEKNTFTLDYLIKKRNEVLKENVSGSFEGSYMKTELLLPPLLTEYSFKGKYYIAEVRGLWKMVNGPPMGGPFVSYTMLDEERGRIVTVEGYAFAPGNKKRNLVKQIEAILSTVEIVKEENKAE